MNFLQLFDNSIVRALLWPLYIILIVFGPLFGLDY